MKFRKFSFPCSVFSTRPQPDRLSVNIQCTKGITDLRKINKLNWKSGSVNQSSRKSRKLSALPFYPNPFLPLHFRRHYLHRYSLDVALNLMKYSNEVSLDWEFPMPSFIFFYFSDAQLKTIKRKYSIEKHDFQENVERILIFYKLLSDSRMIQYYLLSQSRVIA